jgi:hypothetical protein
MPSRIPSPRDSHSASRESLPLARVRGCHPWGTLSAEYADSAGVIRYLLTVFPPGTTIEQRRALIFRRQWLTWGAIVGFVVSSGLSIIVNGWAAIALGTAIYTGPLLIANLHAGTARHGVLEAHAQDLNRSEECETLGRCDALESAAARFLDLDESTNEDRHDAIDYGVMWGAIYREIASETKQS